MTCVIRVRFGRARGGLLLLLLLDDLLCFIGGHGRFVLCSLGLRREYRTMLVVHLLLLWLLLLLLSMLHVAGLV